VVPESGDLAELSPARLYALLALTSGSGALQLRIGQGPDAADQLPPAGRPSISPATISSLSLLRFLQSKGMIEADKALAAEEQAATSGQDIVSVLFQMQVIPAADAHRLLGEHAVFLLDRALATWRGTFTFNKDAPVPPGAFPLGSRWRCWWIPSGASTRRCSGRGSEKSCSAPVVRSGGLALGKVEELALNAQEPGPTPASTAERTGEELLRAHESAATVRLLYLLTSWATWRSPTWRNPSLPRSRRRRSLLLNRHPPPRLRCSESCPRPAGSLRRPPPPASAGAPAGDESRTTPRPPAAAPKAAATGPVAPAAHLRAGTRERVAGRRAGPSFSALGAAGQSRPFRGAGPDRKTATPAETKRNFFVLAKELHPDTVTDTTLTDLKEVKERLFARINEASPGARRRQAPQGIRVGAGREGGERGRVADLRLRRRTSQKAEIFIKARKYQEGLDLLEQAIQMNAEEAEFYAWRGYARFLLSKDRKQRSRSAPPTA